MYTAVLTLQTPHATVHSSDVAEAWLAWHSIPKTKHSTFTVKEDLNTSFINLIHFQMSGFYIVDQTTGDTYKDP